jgi:hypothetical protein
MYITIFFVRVFVFLIFCCLNKYFSSEDDDSSCCCECCECCLEDKKSEGELFKKVVIEEGYKYEGNTKKNVTNSQYGILALPNVPFFSSYNTVNDVIIPFAFELRNEYFEIFPSSMKNLVNSYIEQEQIIKRNVKIFVCYQYLITKIVAKTFADSLEEAINEEILFRPHFFIGKDEINKVSDAISEGFIYCNTSPGNICLVFNNKNKKILDKTVTSFSIHNWTLSCNTPSIAIKIKDTSSDVEIYYSFVLERTKKIAAMTIHFLKCPAEGPYGETINENINPSKINTIAAAINFASQNGDCKVVDFLKFITKES